MNTQTVIGVFDTNNQAQTAKQELVSSGFDASYIDTSTYGQHGTVEKNYRKDDDDSAIENFFENLFGDDDDYDEEYRVRTREVARRGTIVTVQTNSLEKAKRAAAILDRYGAIDFDERHAQYKNKSFDANRNRNELNQVYGDVDKKIEVVKEDVAVGKREVRDGAAIKVRSRIVEKPVEETIRLRREQVYIDREKVDRPASGAEFADKTISVKEVSEEAVVEKDARVVEEITVGKDVDTRSETIRETVRETEVDVERVAGKKATEYKDRK